MSLSAHRTRRLRHPTSIRQFATAARGSTPRAMGQSPVDESRVEGRGGENHVLDGGPELKWRLVARGIVSLLRSRPARWRLPLPGLPCVGWGVETARWI